VVPSGGDVYHLILDRGRISLLEAAHAYSMLSNQGILAGHSREGEDVIQPTTLLMVRDFDGHIWLDWTEPQNQSVSSPQLAYLVTDILSDEISRRETLGHPNPLETGRPSAAKIGQTLSGESAWTIGYTPQRVVAVWLGYPEDEEGSFQESRQVPPTAAGGLWHALIKTTYRNLNMQPWQEPLGIKRINVCDPSGLLPTEDCPTIVTEVFMSGNEPVQVDNLYRTFLINTQTGRLATVYTPPELVEERVYMVVPQEAAAWAKEAGLDIPPDTYDVIFNPSTDNETVSILSPEIFGYVSGQVVITGNAAGDNFAYYRVQIGEGLNPRQWLQIDQDKTEPILEGELVMWDTAGLDGLYAIRLMVVTQEQTVSTTTIQVTVDNRPPVIQVTHPTKGQSFTFPIESSLTIQAQVTDNLGIAKVEFWVNDEMISSLTAPPYAAPWSGSLGEHTLLVVVIDLAGNQSEALVNFIIER
jgi:membrane carboxypeptidase/penicillin-binding protein PbpC